MQDYFQIGEISKLYGIGVDSLRYYEKLGILKPERSESGYRRYRIEDIWKLNIIRDLRGLGFGMEQIRQYLQAHTVDTTLQLLEQEQTAIAEKIRALERLQKNVGQRMEIIRSAVRRPMEKPEISVYPPRRCFCIPEGYSDEHEMDVLIKRLMNLDREHLYVIGSNQLGTVIDRQEAREGGQIRYRAVFVIDEKGPDVLPGGSYLTVSYRGDYDQSGVWVRKMTAYARAQGIRLQGDFLELLWIDIHTSSDVQEHVTELQILVQPD